MARRGERLLDLVDVMDRLRSPGGCPWDARQTHASLVEYLLEEAYETVEAIEVAESEHLREELGDLLLQVIFHARIAQDDPDEGWDIDGVADGIITKLIRRHPHVFADVQAKTAAEVEANWHALKAAEKGRASVTEGIPEALPALLRAHKLLSRSATIDVEPPSGCEEAQALLEESEVTTTREYGDLLLALVAAGMVQGWDAEASLRDAIRRHAERIVRAETQDQ
jgi:XTP/dITP diphosphohydrolase